MSFPLAARTMVRDATFILLRSTSAKLLVVAAESSSPSASKGALPSTDASPPGRPCMDEKCIAAKFSLVSHDRP